MNEYDARRAEVLGLLARTRDIATRLGGTEAHERIDASARRLEDGTLTAVVCGEFKRGKSSLLNALLDEPGLFPTNVDIATSVVSIVEYAESERIDAVCSGGPDDKGAGDAREIGRADIATYVTEQGNPGNALQTQSIVVQTPSPKLASGLRLVDTPGVGGLNQQHTLATYGYLPLADAVVFVTDVTQPLTERELEFVGRVTEHVPLVIFVVSKIDLRPDYEQLVADVAAKVADISGQASQDVVVVPVSSQAKQDYLAKGDAEDLELSNFPAFEEILWQTLERERGQLLLGSPLRDLDGVAAALLLPLRTELDAHRQASQDERTKTRQRLEAGQERLRQVRSQQAQWRRDLDDELRHLRSKMSYQLDTGLEAITQRLETEYLLDETKLATPALIVEDLGRDFGFLLGGVSKAAANEAAAIKAELARRTGLALDVPAFRELKPAPVQIEEPRPEPKGGKGSAKGKFIDAFRQLRGTSLGATIGLTIGMAFPPVGLLVGVAVGAAGGYLTEAEQLRRAEHRNRVTGAKELATRIMRTQKREAAHVLDEAQRAFKQGIGTELSDKINLEQASLDEALKALQAAERRPASGERVRELEQEIRALEQVTEQVGVLAAALGGGPRSAGPDAVDGGDSDEVVDRGDFADE